MIACIWGSGEQQDKIGFLNESTRAIFGRCYAAEPDVLIEQLSKDQAIAEADTLLLTIPGFFRGRVHETPSTKLHETRPHETRPVCPPVPGAFSGRIPGQGPLKVPGDVI